MTKVSKTMKLFDASLVIVGACMPDTAKIFGFRNLLEPAHGAYMIGSNGKCYHSSMTKYDKKALSVKMLIFSLDLGKMTLLQSRSITKRNWFNFRNGDFFRENLKCN